MNCDRADTVLQCYFDNELDALDAANFELHLKECPECVYGLKTLSALRSAIDGANLFERTPAPLRKKVLAGVSSVSGIGVLTGRPLWRWIAVAAALLLAAGLSWRAFSVHRVTSSETMLAAEIIDAHLRSLQPGHLNDIISSDQHTVKPWFDGKLDFSPPVRDLSDHGFPLRGGRLDVIHGRAVAALVYGRRKHLMNVFIWPTNESDASPRTGSRQGFNWLDWRQGGMELSIVSDAGLSDLEQLQRSLAE